MKDSIDEWLGSLDEIENDFGNQFTNNPDKQSKSIQRNTFKYKFHVEDFEEKKEEPKIPKKLNKKRKEKVVVPKVVKKESSEEWGTKIYSIDKTPKERTLKKQWKRFKLILAGIGLAASMLIANRIGEEKGKEIGNEVFNSFELKIEKQQAMQEFYLGKDLHYTQEEWEALPLEIQEWVREPNRVKAALEKYPPKSQTNITDGEKTENLIETQKSEEREFE